jgi:16S rRNA (cytidine1402-2'-O)-methyltransferase
MVEKGKIILFPCPIVEGKIESISPEATKLLHQTENFMVERAKTSRHFLKASKHPMPISEINIHEIAHNTGDEVFLKLVYQGKNIGILSEAGCPGVADPGSHLVSWAHQNEVEVIPLPGPSSILLALMASGMNGQNFAFNGYLSNKKNELIQELKGLESKAIKSKQTQIFMETPYRNQFMIESCIAALSPKTELCVACDINDSTQTIRKKSIQQWQKMDLVIFHKRPCIFLIG